MSTLSAVRGGGRAGASGARNPFVGPVPFTAADADVYFGREYEARELTALLGAERVVLLYSPSGAGKTSLIQARLIKALEKQRYQVLPTVRVGRDRLGGDHSGADRPNRYLESALRSVGWTEAFPLPTLRDYLDCRPVPAGAKGQVLIFDQLEEVFTLNPGDLPAKREFFQQLGEVLATDPEPTDGAPEPKSYWALFALREEYLGALDPYLAYLPCRPVTFRINLLDEKKTMAAVQGPAEVVGTPVAEDAARWLFTSLSRRTIVRPGRREPEVIESSFIDPVHLQIVCREIWSSLPAGQTTVTTADFQPTEAPDAARVDQIDQALTRYYRKAVTAAAAQGRVAEREVRLWIDRYLITYHGLRGTYPLDPLSPPDLPRPALEELVKACVLREEVRNGVSWIELAHDRLVRPVKANNDAWYEANLKPVQVAADLWWKASPEQKMSLLLRGWALVQAEKWARLNPDEVTEKDRAFLTASRRQWVLRRRLTVFAVLALVSLGLGILAYFQHRANVQIQQANVQIQQANLQINANHFAARAELATAADADQSLLYAAGALALQGEADGDFLGRTEGVPNPAARDVAKHALARAAGRSLIGHTGPVTKVDATDKWVITTSSDGTVCLWDCANITGTGRLNPPVVFREHSKAITWTALNSKRTRLATVSVDQRLRVWRLDGDGSPGLEWSSAAMGNTLSRVAFFQAGEREWVCSASQGKGEGGEVYFWRVDDRNTTVDFGPDVTVLGAHSGRVSAIGVPPQQAGAAPQQLVTSGRDEVLVWRINALMSAFKSGVSRVPAKDVSYCLKQAHEGVTDVALFWLPDPVQRSVEPALWLATSGNDKRVHLWRMKDVIDYGESEANPSRGSNPSGPQAKPNYDAFRRTIDGYQGGIVDIAVSQPGTAHEGQLLVSGDVGGGVYVLRLATVLEELFGRGATRKTLVLSESESEKHWVVARPPDSGAKTRGGTSGGRSSITDIDISPEVDRSTWVVASAESGAIEVIEVGHDGMKNRQIVYPGAGVLAIALGRKGYPNMLVAGGRDEVARVWDLKSEDGLSWDIKHLKINTCPELPPWKRETVFRGHTNGELLTLCREALKRRLGKPGIEAYLDKLRDDKFEHDATELRKIISE